MKKLTKIQKLMKDKDEAHLRNIDLSVKFTNAVRDLEIQKKRTDRKEKVLKDIHDVSSGLFNSHSTNNKIVTFELICSVARMAKSEITFIDEDSEKSK